MFSESSECARAAVPPPPPRAPHLPGAGGWVPPRGGWRWMPARRVRVPRRGGERRERKKKKRGGRRGGRQRGRGRRRGGWMEGVTQMAKPLLWPARSHPRASYMSAGASWPRRRRRAGARRAGGRASQSRRPTPPPTAPPAPNRAGPGWGERGADPLLRPPSPARSILSRQRRGGFPRPGAARPCGAETVK